MEVADYTKIVLSRIQQFQPDSAIKIIGYLLLHHTQNEIIEYALGSDKLVINLINEAKLYLSSSPRPANSATVSRPFSSSSSFRVQAPFTDTHLIHKQQTSINSLDFVAGGPTESLGEDEVFWNSFGTEVTRNCYYPDGANIRSPTGISEYPFKACHYYYKGYCRRGINCRFFHGQMIPDCATQMHNMNFSDMVNEDHVLSPASLEKLETEIAELLRSRNGTPVSIASLPMLYLERYGKPLQADGYLTESQRHGKAGFSLTKLLARFRNSILLIDRPHGQHSVVLSEDAPKYMGYRNEGLETNAVTSSSNQIYLTFPAESTFTEDDVSNYFKQFGPVNDVRIPRQEKRMFGFVSFLYPETVNFILAMGCPHYICGARVLVKPYKEKSRLIDRKCLEKLEVPMYQPAQYFQMDPELNLTPRVYDDSILLKQQLMEEHELALELERRCILELRLRSKPLAQATNLVQKMEDLKLQEDNFCYPPISVNNVSGGEQDSRQKSNNLADQDSGHIELPDSPFASVC